LYFWRPGTGGQTQIWKVAADGERPIQITQQGGFSSMESPDGQFLYFTKQQTNGLWRVPTAGGEEILVLDRVRAQLPGYWQVVSDGIFYVDVDEGTISFYSFAQQQSTPIVAMGGGADPWFGGLTVSPDRKSIVFSRHEYSSAEIMLVENFR
jgi:Tol biopolymer transport system component